MVGAKKALAYSVKQVTVTKRNTLLKERLTGDNAKSVEEKIKQNARLGSEP